MTTRFDRDTDVRPLDPARHGPGVFEARMDRGWWVVHGPNGGYVAAQLLRALAHGVEPGRTARSLTVHYTARPEEGPVRIETRIEREGRSLTTASARMTQGERLLALALAAFSKPRPGMRIDHAHMPEVSPPERCPRLPPAIPLHERFESRWAVGEPPGSGTAQALAGGWIRSAEPRIADAALVAAFCDSWPPAVFSLAHTREGIRSVPTVDLTVHFRRELPLPGARPDDFHLVVFRTRVVESGFLEEDGEVWSRDGLLLAHSRQLAALT